MCESGWPIISEVLRFYLLFKAYTRCRKLSFFMNFLLPFFRFASDGVMMILAFNCCQLSTLYSAWFFFSVNFDCTFLWSLLYWLVFRFFVSFCLLTHVLVCLFLIWFVSLNITLILFKLDYHYWIYCLKSVWFLFECTLWNDVSEMIAVKILEVFPF